MGHPGLNIEDMLQTSCACGVVSIDAGGKVTFVSPEAEKILLWSSSDKTRVSRRTASPAAFVPWHADSL